jgi:hypothetical protein
MDHTERACAGLIALAKAGIEPPAAFLCIEPHTLKAESISGVPVYESTSDFSGKDFGTIVHIVFIPLYADASNPRIFRIYADAYEEGR